MTGVDFFVNVGDVGGSRDGLVGGESLIGFGLPTLNFTLNNFALTDFVFFSILLQK